MRSKVAAVVLVLVGSAMLFVVDSISAAATGVGGHSGDTITAAAVLPSGMTGSVASVLVLIGAVGLVVGLTRRGRRSLAARRAAARRRAANEASLGNRAESTHGRA